jgi:hypothetical protein
LDRNAITSRLIGHGQLVFNGPRELIQFTELREAGGWHALSMDAKGVQVDYTNRRLAKQLARGSVAQP